MKTNLMLAAFVTVFCAGGAAMAGPGLEKVRAEALGARTAVGNEQVFTTEAAKLMVDAGEMFGDAIEILSDGDPVRAKKALTRISKALKLLKKAAKKEKSAEFDAFVDDRARRLWLVVASLYEGAQDPVVNRGDQGDLERRYWKKMRGPGKAALAQKYATAIKKMKRAWGTLLKLDPDP